VSLIGRSTGITPGLLEQQVDMAVWGDIDPSPLLVDSAE
jgi:hypothetical protein